MGHSYFGVVEAGEFGRLEPRGREIRDEAPVTQADNPIGKGDREFGLMEAAEHGNPALLRDRPQHAEDHRRRRRVEAGYWLIGQDEATLLGEHARDRDALLLATRERSARCSAYASKPT